MELSGKSYHVQIRTDWIINQLVVKVKTTFIRLLDVFLLLPKRLLRLLRHIGRGLRLSRGRERYWWESELGHDSLSNIFWWWLGTLIYVLECCGIGEVYETLTDWIKFNTRGLYDWEVKLAKSVYGDSINYKRVRIDELAFAGPKQQRFCYVSFFLINSWGRIPNSTFLHEMMHIWQYQKMGARYMMQALRGQHSPMGYNYGGITALRSHLEKGKKLRHFNLEQQADIVTDYYLITQGYQPQWGQGTRSDLPVYEKFIENLDK